MLPTALDQALSQYEKQVELAKDRIQRFEWGMMSTSDLGPPLRDTTQEAIDFERRLIATYQQGIDWLKKLDAEMG